MGEIRGEVRRGGHRPSEMARDGAAMWRRRGGEEAAKRRRRGGEEAAKRRRRGGEEAAKRCSELVAIARLEIGPPCS